MTVTSDGQGYLFSPPVDQLGVERLLRAERRHDEGADAPQAIGP